MFGGTRVKVFDNVIGFSLQQMVVTVFDQEVPDFFATNVTLILAVEPAEGTIRFKLSKAPQRLSLALY